MPLQMALCKHLIHTNQAGGECKEFILKIKMRMNDYCCLERAENFYDVLAANHAQTTHLRNEKAHNDTTRDKGRQ